MDADSNVAATELLIRKRVIKILRVVGIDREDREFAVVEPADNLPRLHAVGNRRRFAFDVRGKLGREIVFQKNPEQFGPRFVRAAN